MLICFGWWQSSGPSVASGERVPGVGAGVAWAGRCGEGAESGEDLGEQVVPRWQPQGERSGVADEPARDGDQLMSQGGDHPMSISPSTWGCKLACTSPRGRAASSGNDPTHRAVRRRTRSAVLEAETATPGEPVETLDEKRSAYIDLLMKLADRTDGELPPPELLDRIERALGYKNGRTKDSL